MTKRLELSPGEKYGDWEVISMVDITHGQSKAICKCKCGKTMEIVATHLKQGHRKRCMDCALLSMGKHNMTLTPTWKTWSGMRERCNNQNSKYYKYYGGRGIKICEEWNDFEKFFEDMGEKPIGMSIDRIDVNGWYRKENCRWASVEVQNQNRRNSIFVKYKGKEYRAKELATHLGMKYFTLWKRLKSGIPIDAPLKPRSRNTT